MQQARIPPVPSASPSPKIWPAGEGAWQIRLPLPWALTSVNVFVFRRGDDDILLDTGIRTDASLGSLEAALATIDSGWHRIGEVLVSHLHPDHMGGAAEIRRRTGAPVRMPAREAELVKPQGRNRKFFAEAAEFLEQHGMPSHQVATVREQTAKDRGTYERLEVDGILAPGEQVPFDGGTLEAISAPGHSPALLCFYCPEQKILFSTDAILPHVTPNIGLHWFYQDDPLEDYFATLDNLATIEAEEIVPSHGRPFVGHREWIATTRAHHFTRCDSILEVLDGQRLNAFQIAGRIWGEDRSLLDRRFGMAEALAHLQYMGKQSHVMRTETDKIVHWSRT